MTRPTLKQFVDLVESDFQDHPVWIGCHTADYDEDWYDETDEETFRPRTGQLPARPSEGMLLLQATATLSDGSQVAGFLTPALQTGDLGTIQPHLFLGGRKYGLWGGIFGYPEQYKLDFTKAIGKDRAQVFPLTIRAAAGLSTGVVEAEIPGWPEPGDRASRATTGHQKQSWIRAIFGRRTT